MFHINLCIFLLICGQSVFGQIGIKSPVIRNLVYNDTTNSNAHYVTLPSNLLNRTEHNTSSNANFNFLNKTLTSRAPGICFKEVPTVSLVKDPKGYVPAGNGSDPSLSRIQVCCPGYERNMHNLRKCDPICTKECVNGLCVAPDRCECFPEHVRNLAGYCVPTCPIGCSHGECRPDGACFCDPGYQLESKRKFCVPKCSLGCLNGNCTAPETCTCNTGYELSTQKRCEPVCKGGCAFGQCVAPEQCSCNPGYSKVDGVCQPICTRGCINGKCTAPDVCSCNPGWTLDGIETTCVPHCDRPCFNGKCTAANTCTCNRGYTLDDFDAFRCIPHCSSGCPNGICSGPNMCICKLGFVKDRSIKGSQNCVPRD